MKSRIGFTHVLLGTSKMLVGGCVELLIVHILTPIHHSLCKVCMVCRLIQCMFYDYRTESGLRLIEDLKGLIRSKEDQRS